MSLCLQNKLYDKVIVRRLDRYKNFKMPSSRIPKMNRVFTAVLNRPALKGLH